MLSIEEIQPEKDNVYVSNTDHFVNSLTSFTELLPTYTMLNDDRY